MRDNILKSAIKVVLICEVAFLLLVSGCVTLNVSLLDSYRKLPDKSLISFEKEFMVYIYTPQIAVSIHAALLESNSPKANFVTSVESIGKYVVIIKDMNSTFIKNSFFIETISDNVSISPSYFFEGDTTLESYKHNYSSDSMMIQTGNSAKMAHSDSSEKSNEANKYSQGDRISGDLSPSDLNNICKCEMYDHITLHVEVDGLYFISSAWKDSITMDSSVVITKCAAFLFKKNTESLELQNVDQACFESFCHVSGEIIVIDSTFRVPCTKK